MKGRILLTLFLLPLLATAQERLSLSDAITRTLEHNFDIRIAKATSDKAKRNNTIGNAGFLPTVDATGVASKGIGNTRIEFADGSVQDRTSAGTRTINGQLTASWTIFDGGRMFLNKRQLNAQQELADVQLRQQMQTTVSQTIQAYAQAVFQLQQGIATDTGMVLAKARMDLSKAKYDIGTGVKTDYLQARVDYNARKSDSLTHIAAVQAATASLNILMGQEADANYILDDSLVSDTTLQPADLSKLLDMNYSLDVYKRTADISRLNYKIARSYYYPVLGLNGGYGYNKTTNDAGNSLFNRNYGPTGSVSLSIPIFQGGTIRRQVAVASIQTLQDDLRYSFQRSDLGRQYRTAWANYNVSVYAYKMERENIGYAKENLDIQLARFRVGIATTLEEREAEDSYVQALVLLYTAAYNLKVNETVVLELENELVQ